MRRFCRWPSESADSHREKCFGLLCGNQPIQPHLLLIPGGPVGFDGAAVREQFREKQEGRRGRRHQSAVADPGLPLCPWQCDSGPLLHRRFRTRQFSSRQRRRRLPTTTQKCSSACPAPSCPRWSGRRSPQESTSNPVHAVSSSMPIWSRWSRPSILAPASHAADETLSPIGLAVCDGEAQDDEMWQTR